MANARSLAETLFGASNSRRQLVTRLKFQRQGPRGPKCDHCGRRESLEAHEHLVTRQEALVLPEENRDRIMAEENILILCPDCHDRYRSLEAELTAILMRLYGRERILAWAASLGHPGLYEEVERKLHEQV